MKKLLAPRSESPRNGGNELPELYQSWRKLTEDEGQAILAGAWPQVQRCQDAKSDLQTRILATSEPTSSKLNLPSAGNPVVGHQPFQHLLREVIQMERRNQKWLAEQQQVAQTQRSELEAANRNLQKLRQSYGPKRRSCWHCYS